MERPWKSSMIALAGLLLVPSASAMSHVQWSADGRRMAVVTGAQARIFDYAGNELKLISAQGKIEDYRISPTGQEFAYVEAGGKACVQAIGTGAEVDIFVPENADQIVKGLEWSSDGRNLIYTVVDTEKGKKPQDPPIEKLIRVFHVRADGSGKKLLASYAP